MAQSKILEQLRKWAWLIVAVLALVTVVLIVRTIRQSGAYAADKEAFEKTLAAGRAEIASLNEEKAAWAQRAAAYMAAAESEAEQRKAAEAAKAAKEKENAALKAKIAAMPDDQIVSETRTKLGVMETDVFKNAFGIQFSLSAGRKNLSRLYDADFSIVKEQEFTKLIDSYKAEVISLRGTIAAQARQIQLGEAVEAEYNSLMLSYGDILAKSERQAKWLKVTIGGVAVGVTAAGLYLIFRGKK